MSLSKIEYQKLKTIQDKIVLNNATSVEMDKFLDLIIKSGNEFEMLEYMQTIGFDTIDEVRIELKKRQKNSNVSTGLAVAGGAILLALLLSR